MKKIDSSNQVKYGAVISYILIFLNAIYGLVVTKFILGCIGNSEYGVYQSMAAFTASISILDLGIGSTVQRYVSKFKVENNQTDAENIVAMGIIETTAIAALICIIACALFASLGALYGAKFTEVELYRAKQIFPVLAILVVAHMYENVLYGAITGHNKFVFCNSFKCAAVLVKAIIYYVILPIYSNAFTLVVVLLGLEVVQLITFSLYLKRGLSFRIYLHSFDLGLLKESAKYSLILFIQTLIIQFNGNVDNVVIGALVGAEAVTVYSFAIQMFSMYEQLSTAISGVVLPTVTSELHDDPDPAHLEGLVIKFGRIQFIILGAALAGFFVCGKEFFMLWLGKGFEDCWYLALILMVPVTFPLIVNVCLSILKAKNMLGFRTISMAYSFVFNAVFTIFGVKYYGYYMAAIGT